MDVPVLNMKGEQVGSITVDEQTLGGEINPALIKQAYVRYHANQRQGSARTKSRGMVEGSTKKLYRQKGTGRARAGAIRTPIRKGGGVTFAKTKTREAYRLDMPLKMRRAANRNALLAKLLDGEVRVIDALTLDVPKTREVENMLKACQVDRSCLVALGADGETIRRSARNIEGVTTVPVEQMNCFDMLNHRYMVIARADLEAWLNGASSRTGKDAKNIKGRGAAAGAKEAA